MKNVLEMLEESREKYPDKEAFADEKNSITYDNLVVSAQRIGSYIASDMGLINKPIAVLLDKTVFAVEAFMGVLYSGNFYVVLDADSPVERLKLICDTLKPVAVITDKEHYESAEQLQKNEHIYVMENMENTDICEVLLKGIREKLIDTDPVYALFTSGSTGVPKGAVISHRNVLSYISWYTEAFGIDENTVFGNQTPFYFSMSVSDMYSTICSGAQFHIIPRQLFSFPIKLMQFLNERKVNTIYWVPSALCIVANWKMFDYEKLPYIKKVLFAGEVMPTRQLNYWIENIPDAMYANLFGPTETTDICTYYVVDRSFADDEPLPMGKACNNCDVFVLDEAGQLVSPPKDKQEKGWFSKEGELYARGSFLSMGYYGNEEKTSAAFVQNPLNPHYPEPVYKTGDLVRYNSYGELVYITRKDFQIKHMGYRIELGEIEAAAGAIEGIKSCACVYNSDEDKIVFIYEGKKMEDKDILDKLAARVPHYMVPNRLVRIKSMPHNQNGKIDRVWLKNNY